MKIMQTIAGGDVGGAEEFFVRLTRAFADKNLLQRVVARPNQSRYARLASAGVQTVELPFGGRLDWRTERRLATQIEAFNPDIVLSWMSRATQITTKAIARTSVKPLSIGRLGGYYDIKNYRGCDHLIGNTPDIVRYLSESGWPQHRIHYVPNFVDAASGTLISRESLELVVDDLFYPETDKPKAGIAVHLHLTMLGIEKDLRIIEVPITFNKRIGKSKMGTDEKIGALKIGLQFLWFIIKS